VDGRRVEGRYSNRNYGFSVSLPDGMVGLASPLPQSENGFTIDLGNPMKFEYVVDSWSSLLVEADYNSEGWASLDEAAEDVLSWVEDGGNEVRSMRRLRVRLGGLPATRFVQVYRNNRGTWVNDLTLAFRKERGVEVVYEVSINTPQGRYGRDKAAADYLLKTFCLQPLP
jgi:hypothetical protein